MALAARGFVARLFYPLLYLVIVSLVFALLAKPEDKASLLDLVGARKANAQTPDDPLTGPGIGAAPGGRTSNLPPGFQQPLPGAPYVPQQPASRPASWPGGAPPGVPGMEAIPPGPYPHTPVVAPPDAMKMSVFPETPFEGTKVIARVGTEVILAADLLAGVNEIIGRNADKIPSDKMDLVRKQLMMQRLEPLIQTKLLMLEVKRKIPEEGLKKFEGKIGEQYEKMEVPNMIAKSGLKSRAELEEMMRSTGTTLEREQKAFGERLIAADWVRQNVKFDGEITHEDILAYYHQHAAGFAIQEMTRWEQLVVRFDKYPSKQDAYRVIAEAGNRILSGESFTSVAHAISDGPTARIGGMQPWTTRGSLASTALDQALFSLPVGQLSPIIEEKDSFQIVRVIEHQTPGRVPFLEAQVDIKKQIRVERTEAEVAKFIAGLRKKTTVWTIFDDEIMGAAAASAQAQRDDRYK